MSHELATFNRRISRVTSVLQGKWKLPILYAMRSGPVRLSELVRLVPGASKKALRAHLRDLETAQIVMRRDLSDRVLHVECDFASEMKQIVCPLLDQLAQWGEILEQRKQS
jgi:DNA-binding HxlR family transcriptional regulator